MVSFTPQQKKDPLISAPRDDLQPGPSDCTIGRAAGQPPRNPHFDGWDTETARPNRCGIPRLVFKRVLPQLGADGVRIY
jgi:hypothetical protein